MEDNTLNDKPITFNDIEELMHWGIKGQKWGRRRYQNPDGSLTPEGRKRYYNDDGSLTKKGEKYVAKETKRLTAQKAKVSDAAAKTAKLNSMRQEIDDIASGKKIINKPKSTKEMSDEELRDAKNRLQLEKDYNRLYDELNPTEVAEKSNKALDLAKDLFNGAVKPAMISAGKDLVTDFMKEQGKHILGLDKDPPPGSMEYLKKMAEKAKLKYEIEDYKNAEEAAKNAAKDKESLRTKSKLYDVNDKYVGKPPEKPDNFDDLDDDDPKKKEYYDELNAYNERYKRNNNGKDSSEFNSAKENAQRKVDEYNQKRETEYKNHEGEYRSASEYNAKGKDIVDSVLNTDRSEDRINKGLLLEDFTNRKRYNQTFAKGESRTDEILDRYGKHITFFKHSDLSLNDVESLIHHGIKGQKWGQRRYQNPNGSLTPEGKIHRNKREGRNEYHVKKYSDQDMDDLEKSITKTKSSKFDEDSFKDDVFSIANKYNIGDKKLSSTSPEDIKTVSKELSKNWDDSEKQAKTKSDEEQDFLNEIDMKDNPSPDTDYYNEVKAYREQYMKDPDLYAKTVIRKIEREYNN